MLASCLFCAFLTEAMGMVFTSAPCDSWRKKRREVGMNRTGRTEPGNGLLRTRICYVHFDIRNCHIKRSELLCLQSVTCSFDDCSFMMICYIVRDRSLFQILSLSCSLHRARFPLAWFGKICCCNSWQALVLSCFLLRWWL